MMDKEYLEKMKLKIKCGEVVISQEQYALMIDFFAAMFGRNPSIKFFSDFLLLVVKEAQRNIPKAIKNRKDKDETI